MTEYTFGANILENLTTGMYQDSKVIYREYIQNACDQIDKAEKRGILRPRKSESKYPDLGEGKIDIWLDHIKRKIIIEDNATGIQASEFQRILGSIADSDKVMGRDKGFRGIGRLCGLAYCKQLIFTSRWQEEDIVSIMYCDAHKMRQMINDANTNVKKHSASEVLNSIVTFSTRPATREDSEHFFRVELQEINKENDELFGEKHEAGLETLKDYLSFVAPVPYHSNFIYRLEIYAHASELGVNIDEYNIRLNGEQILKKYKTHLKTGNGQDHVYGVKFHDFFAKDNSLIGWMWFGQTTFKASIKTEEMSRCIRLRKENIQIGDEATLRNLFSKDHRGNGYFIGEVFGTSSELIPNSQRSYFNENPIRVDFEYKLRDYFNNTLYHIYYEGSEINSSIRKINAFNEKEQEYAKKLSESTFVSDEEKRKEEKELEVKKKDAEKAQKILEKKKNHGRSMLASQILERRLADIQGSAVDTKAENTSYITPVNILNDEEVPQTKGSKKFLVDSLFPNYNRNERKLLSEFLEKVFTIIQNSTDKKNATHLIERLKENLK